MMDANTNVIGDACIAAPFTYKYESIKCVSHILRQGRCTLVTTLQMYKILAINGVMLSYYLSVLYRIGLKNGDFQSTIFGVLIALYFFFISRARPLQKLQLSLLNLECLKLRKSVELPCIQNPCSSSGGQITGEIAVKSVVN